jgi:hypothetical protein
LFYSLKIANFDNNYTHEEITTRFYLHPKVEFWFVVWQEILPLLGASPVIRQAGFQSKVANFFRFSPSDFAKMKNQHDRILLYFGEKGRSEALRIIQDYVTKNTQYFENCHSLAAPLVDQTGQSLNYVFTSDEPKISSFNNNHAQILQEIIQKFASNYQLPTGQNPTVKEVILKAKNDQNARNILTKYITNQYPQTAKQKGFRTDNIAFLEN